jgi:murein DD-endopeptidase MepM/ murein hydrolase activator NlpD
MPRGNTLLVENHPEVDVAPAPVREAAREIDREFDTVSIERVLNSLEPVDQTTSFESEPTARLPMLRAEPPSTGGKRRAVKHAGGRGPLFRGFPSAPVLMGIAALAVSIGGVATVNDAQTAAAGSDAPPSSTHAATALGGSSGTGTVSARKSQVSRDNDRQAQAAAAGQVKLQAAADAAAKVRAGALTELAAKAEVQAKVIAKNLWTYPLEPVVLTARFGQYGLWSSYHTGLDFNGNTGDQIHAIANGVVVSASYDGSYGNKTVVRLEDGTEIWYCHQNAFFVSAGDTVRAGEVIGEVGATGHVTGSHLHVEVRPGGGDPVDPYTAMQQHGLF